LVIDPGLGGKEIWEAALAAHGLSFDDVSLVLLSHSHYDHAYNARLFPNATIAASRSAIEKLEQNSPKTFFELSGLKYSDSGKHRILKDGEKIALGGLRLDCISTPGHCNCAMCFFGENSGVLFSGDTIFPGGSLPRVFDSTQHLLSLSYKKIARLAEGFEKKGAPIKLLAPGHGDAGDFKKEFEAAKAALFG
jgi:glyoxylase-like metal-dependent hydrolase (beta-lactamase superfamily II)